MCALANALEYEWAFRVRAGSSWGSRGSMRCARITPTRSQFALIQAGESRSRGQEKFTGDGYGTDVERIRVGQAGWCD